MPLSLYLHIPFCTVRCAYCDFNTYAGLDDLIPDYAAALRRELAVVGQMVSAFSGDGVPGEVHTVYVGGGTPSLLPAAEVRRLLDTVRKEFPLTAGCEITFEANPESAGRRWIEAALRAGVNRLSLGVQSAQPSELEFLDRRHSFARAAAVVENARTAGIPSLNLDLIYGLPDQRLEVWVDTVAQTLALSPDHLSLYSLTLEHGTPLRARFAAGLFSPPDPDLAADMVEAAGEMLAAAGFRQYEISNWARGGRRPGLDEEPGLPVHACRHNVQVWRNLPYLGLGAGAHGCARGWRYANVLSPRAYLERMRRPGPVDPPCGPAVAGRTRVDRPTEMDETMMLGLRLTEEGIRSRAFADRFGEPPAQRYGSRLADLASTGLLTNDEDGFRLTPRGRLLGNRVFAAFV